jgi:hypothetical protein
MHTRRPFYKKPIFIITMSVVLFLGAILRLALPRLALSLTNYELNKLSPHIGMVVADMELQVTRGEYTAHNIKAFLKKTGEPFVIFDRINVLTNWKNIWQGEVIARIYSDGLKLTLSDEVVKNLSKEKAHIQKLLTNKHFEIKKFFLSDSHVHFKKFKYAIDDISLEIDNMENFVFTASVFGPSPTRVSGIMDLNRTPFQWNLDAEMRDFDLTTIQELLKEHFNISVTQGSMDLYAEMESIGDEVFGYLKPFITGLKMSDPTQKLDMDTEVTVASKIPIGFDTKFKFEVMDFLKPGIENRIGPEDLQAQEAEN